MVVSELHSPFASVVDCSDPEVDSDVDSVSELLVVEIWLVVWEPVVTEEDVVVSDVGPVG